MEGKSNIFTLHDNMIHHTNTQNKKIHLQNI